MDPKAIEEDIKANLIRAGKIFKRSKFLKEWRPRYIVLTSNFLYTFTSQSKEQVTDVIPIRDLKSYKSYLRKDEEMIPPGFKLRSADEMLYFCTENCYEKWSWIVTLERLLDFKYMGKSSYNTMDWVKTKGFDSQIEVEKAGVKVNFYPQAKKPGIYAQYESQNKQKVEDQAQMIEKSFREQQKQLDRKRIELQKKQALLDEQKRLLDKSKNVNLMADAPLQKQSQALEQMRESSRIAQLKNIYENRITMQRETIPDYGMSKGYNKQDKKQEISLTQKRGRVVSYLFEEFKKEADNLFGLKFMVDFLVNAAGEQKMGYSPYVVIEGKSNENRLTFSEVFIEYLNLFVDYEKCENLMRFIEICIFQIPGLFNTQQTTVIQKKLRDIFQRSQNEETLCLIIKNMFIMHKIQKYDRNDIYHKLDRLMKEAKNEEMKNWARKMRDVL